jgi:hypothetical protein
MMFEAGKIPGYGHDGFREKRPQSIQQYLLAMVYSQPYEIDDSQLTDIWNVSIITMIK